LLINVRGKKNKLGANPETQATLDTREKKKQPKQTKQTKNTTHKTKKMSNTNTKEKTGGEHRFSRRASSSYFS